jgi:hypothetical protein
MEKSQPAAGPRTYQTGRTSPARNQNPDTEHGKENSGRYAGTRSFTERPSSPDASARLEFDRMKTIAILSALAGLAFAPPAQARLTFVCPGGVLPNGPEKGAPMGINAKHNMTCGQVRHAIAQGTYFTVGNRLGFRSHGSRCRVAQLFYQGRFVVGEQIACSASRRSFKFDWGP